MQACGARGACVCAQANMLSYYVTSSTSEQWTALRDEKCSSLCVLCVERSSNKSLSIHLFFSNCGRRIRTLAHAIVLIVFNRYKSCNSSPLVVFCHQHFLSQTQHSNYTEKVSFRSPTQRTNATHNRTIKSAQMIGQLMHFFDLCIHVRCAT